MKSDSAPEVTTLWRYTNLFIIIIIIFLTLSTKFPRVKYWRVSK